MIRTCYSGFLILLSLQVYGQQHPNDSTRTLTQERSDSVVRSVVKEEAVIEGQQITTVRAVGTLNTINMKEGELFKAACCNLSESFETNPSVDVSFTDALTGVKQIQLLGLSGLYAQMMTESRPDARGLYANYGLSYTPGTWVESIQVSKGSGSVVNGFESMTGHINIELKKPEGKEILYLNGFANELGRYEGNAVATSHLSKQLSTLVAIHADQWVTPLDRNKDGFQDMPMVRSYSILNRWKLEADNWKFQLGGKLLRDYKFGGQMDEGMASGHHGTTGTYVIDMRNDYWQLFGKAGRIFKNKPYRSLGLIGQLYGFNQQSRFGMRQLQLGQRSAYGNVIWQDVIGNTNHQYRTGASVQYDLMQEDQTGLATDTLSVGRQEAVYGLYYEHTWHANDQLTVIGGLRADHNSLFGSFITPRVHVKYALNETNTIRLNIGRGQRSANPIADQLGALASSRQLTLNGRMAVRTYNLTPEVSWNGGLSYSKDFEWLNGFGTWTVDLYSTIFTNQVIADFETPGLLKLYNKANSGYSNSLQAEINFSPIKRLEARVAYRWYDAQTAFESGWAQRPLVAAHRGFINLAYSTRSKWSADLTMNITGSKRLPASTANIPQDRWEANSPAFVTLNAQLTKSLKSGFDFYIGVENLTDYRQEKLIIASDRPFGSTFDAGIVWGPPMGRMAYAGFRFKLMRPEDEN